jgi:hypothetical protein
LVNEDLSEVGEDVAVPRELMLQFIAGYLPYRPVVVLRERPKLPPSQIHDIFRHLVTEASDGRLSRMAAEGARNRQRLAVASSNRLGSLRSVFALPSILAAPLATASSSGRCLPNI